MKRIDPDAVPAPAFVLREAYDSVRVPWHTHRKAQLVAITSGTLTVVLEGGRWILTPQQAVWILPETRHRLLSRRPFTLCTLYVEPGLVPLPPRCQVVAVEPLLRELLAAAGGWGPDLPRSGPADRLVQVLLDRLPEEPLAALFVPSAKDPRLVRICRILEEDPGDQRTLAQLAPGAGVSARNAQRLFVKETGLTFGRWRQRFRLMTAAERLSEGDDVTRAALASGYQDASSLIQRFKEVWGTTPGRYLSWLAQAAGSPGGEGPS